MNGVGGGEVGGQRVGWGGGEGLGIMEPTEAAARKGVEQAPPCLIPPSASLLCSGVFSSLGTLGLAVLVSWWKRGLVEIIYHLVFIYHKSALGIKSLQ